MSTNLVLCLSLPILLATAWLYTAHTSRMSTPHLRNKRICLLIAHPDDEAMFFSPTLLALTAEDSGNHLKILCLSSGNADNLGPTRKKELLSSAQTLGLRSSSDVFVIDSPTQFPDSMTTTWSASALSNVLSSAFGTSVPSSSSRKPPTSQRNGPAASAQAPGATIDILLTFDEAGISYHPNHTSLHAGAHLWLKTLMANHAGWECPVQLYTLHTTSLFRKYIGVLDAPITMLLGVLRSAKLEKKKSNGEGPARLLFVSDIFQWWRGIKAMTGGHKSQMRWFRWGWVSVGRYMVVNDLKREV